MDLAHLSLFPLWPVREDGTCGCGKSSCTSKPGKHPAFMYSSLGPGQQVLLDGYDVAVATGSRSGLFVVDLDGPEAVQWWERQNGDSDWNTYAVETSRGLHLYYALPDGVLVANSQSALAPGIDIRGEGGFVVAAGSTHVSGHVYREVDSDAEVQPAPAWLLAWPGLRGTVRDARDEGENAPVPWDRDSEGYAQAVEKACHLCSSCEPSISGHGGQARLWDVCLDLIRTYRLPLEDAKTILLEVFNPRCEPSWSEGEISHKLEDARDRSDRWTGEPWSDERWLGFLARAKTKGRGVRPDAVISRRQHDPGHEYSFFPGKSVNFGSEPSTKLLVEVANMLSTHHDWNGSLQWDSFRSRVIAVCPPLRLDAEKSGLSDSDITGIRMWLECNGSKLEKGDYLAVIQAAAQRVSFHPVIEYLETCRSRGEESGILDVLSERLFGVPDSHEFLKKTLVAAVRRIIHPGTKVDTMLVLAGPQGAMKSSCVRELFGAEFTRSQMPDLESKDASVALQGMWGVELAELDKILRAGNETVLEFLSRLVDDFRAPYARCESHVPRSCVFIGTTNSMDFLRDSNGNRRYWPLAVSRVDLAYLRAHRDEIWGAALTLAEDSTYLHYFPDESVLRDAHDPFITRGPWHDLVRGYLCGKDKVLCEDVYKDAICGGIADMSRYGKIQQHEVTDTLKRLGCARKKSNGSVWWTVPEELSSLKAGTGVSAFAGSRLAATKPS